MHYKFVEFISKNNQHQFKDTNASNKEIKVYTLPGSSRCMDKYLERLPPDAEYVYMRPLDKIPNLKQPWYTKQRVGYTVEPVYYGYLGTNQKCPDYQGVRFSRSVYMMIYHLGPQLGMWIMQVSTFSSVLINRFHCNTLKGFIPKLFATSGLEGLCTSHSLQATSITRMFKTDVPEKIIAESGYKSLSISYVRTHFISPGRGYRSCDNDG